MIPKANFATNFFDLFDSVGRTCSPDKPFVVTNKVLTYGVALDRIKKLATHYSNLGLQTGDRVIIATRHDADLVIFFLSLMRCGIAAVVVGPDTRLTRFRNLVARSEAKLIIADSELRSEWSLDTQPQPVLEVKIQAEKNTLLKKLLKKESVNTVDVSYPALLDKLAPTDAIPKIDSEQDAYILFTSGTISEPKGVQISHKNLFAHLVTLSRQFGYSSDCRILNILPLDHTDGLIQGPMIAFFNGATVYRPFRFSIPNLGPMLDAVYTHRITHFVTVPTVLSLIHKLSQDHESCFTTTDFRFIISAAAYLEPALWEGFEKRFNTRIANVYGLTETVTGGLFSGPSERDHKIGTVGKPVDCEVRIVDEKGVEVPSDTIGEVVMRGNHIMTGYCNAPEETAKVLKNGWLHTGDLGILGSDGFVRISGRMKSIIKSGGMNINPHEITEVVNLHPGVLESTTMGYPDETWGEVVISCVVGKPGNVSPEQDLVEFARKHLEPYKIPARVFMMPALPKGPSGKVRFDELKTTVGMLMKQTASGPGIPDIKTVILETAAKCFRSDIQAIRMQYGPSDLSGWDSLAHMEFVAALEERLDIKLNTAEIMSVECLSDAESIAISKLNH